MPRKVLSLLLILPLLFCGCNTKTLRQANYDLADAINHASLTTVQLTQNGTLSTSEENQLLPLFYTMSNESDGITKCIDQKNLGQSGVTCIQPLLQAINTQTAQASLGVKSPTAQATMSTVITGITVIFSEFVKAGAQPPTGAQQ